MSRQRRGGRWRSGGVGERGGGRGRGEGGGEGEGVGGGGGEGVSEFVLMPAAFCRMRHIVACDILSY